MALLINNILIASDIKEDYITHLNTILSLFNQKMISIFL